MLILCGGLGTRIKSVSNGLPKILLELNGTSFLEIQFKHLFKRGFRSFFYISGYKSTLISKELEKIKIKYPNANIVSLDEGKKRLGTGGALKKLIEHLPNNFFLTYGDNYLNLNFYEMEKLFYKSGKNLISIYKKQGFINNQFFFYGILNLLPFVIYDPELFYPRHIIIGLCFLSLNNIYNKKWSMNLENRLKELQ